MALTVNSELASVLNKAKLSFCWDDFTRTWHLERAYGSRWQSVMYLAKDQVDAEEEAIKHIRTYYLDPIEHPSSREFLLSDLL